MPGVVRAEGLEDLWLVNSLWMLLTEETCVIQEVPGGWQSLATLSSWGSVLWNDGEWI